MDPLYMEENIREAPWVWWYDDELSGWSFDTFIRQRIWGGTDFSGNK